MKVRQMFVLLLALAALLCVACTPSGDRVKSDIEEKSLCKLDHYKVKGDPTKDNQGYLHYHFTATVTCTSPRSFYSRKYSEATAIKGEAEMLGAWFGLRHELTRYEFEEDTEE